MEKILLEEAYRKLKGSVYLDKTIPYLRAEIANYEASKFDEKMEKLFNAVNDGTEWATIENNIIDSICAYTFPKKMQEREKDDEAIVISNIGQNHFSIEKYNNFINMSVEGHILGVLWILLVGHKMDKLLPSSCFGNRLTESLVFEEGKATTSPNLFKPYFSQYESWRNQGLVKAKEIVNDEGQSVVITMLDLTRYYYNIDFSEKKYWELVLQFGEEQNKTISRVNGFVYKVIRKYSECLGENESNMLPIGFLPSNILSNMYLMELDDRIQNMDSTKYYGRYVDDMIIVTQVDKSHLLKNRVRQKGVGQVSNYMMKLLEENGIIGESNNEIRLLGYSKLSIQKNKFKFFYIDKNGYDTIIEKIRKDIYKNSSEFRFLPEKMMSNINEDVLKLDRDDTVNKLRAVNGVSIDKYTLSKILGKNVLMSEFAEENDMISFVKSIEKILQNSELIRNYILWENILNYYVINAKWNKIVDFTNALLSALEYMDEESGKQSKEYNYLTLKQIDSVGDSLIKYFHGCFVRATAIVWGKEIREVIEKISGYVNEYQTYQKYNDLFDVFKLTEMRKKCCSSRLINKELLPVAIEECMSAFKPNDRRDNVVRFNELEHYLESKEESRYRKDMKRFAPYIRSPFDILYTNLLNQIKNRKVEQLSDSEIVSFLHRKYAENFTGINVDYLKDYIWANDYGFDGNYQVTIHSLDDRKDKNQIRIAVANVRMQEEDIEANLKDKKRNISLRCAEINRIVKEAIRFKSDILIFPESYLPIRYLPRLEKKVRGSNMTIIGGVEHVRVGNKVYNYTAVLIPMIQDKMRYTIPFFHLKKYYSPHELDVISKYGCVAVSGNSHTLFEWKGVRFAPYCCFELTSIEERAIFKRDADIVFGIEWNPDVDYFSNIMESLSRDISCYCVQSNMSEYGDSRIIQPSKRMTMNIARVKGGKNGLVIIDDVNIEKLRNHHMNGNDDELKPLPAAWKN